MPFEPKVRLEIRRRWWIGPAVSCLVFYTSLTGHIPRELIVWLVKHSFAVHVTWIE